LTPGHHVDRTAGRRRPPDRISSTVAAIDHVADPAFVVHLELGDVGEPDGDVDASNVALDLPGQRIGECAAVIAWKARRKRTLSVSFMGAQLLMI
jgi:hypothetical protein